VGELINLRDWQAEKRRRAIQASVDKINKSIKDVQEFLANANPHRGTKPGYQVPRERSISGDSDKSDFIFDNEDNKT
jgi:hypothetical protein